MTFEPWHLDTHDGNMLDASIWAMQDRERELEAAREAGEQASEGGPAVAVIIPPTQSITITIVLPEPLASHLRLVHEMHTAGECRPLAFDEWLIERLADLAYRPDPSRQTP